MTIVKFMLSAVVVGMIGIFVLGDLGVKLETEIKPTNIGADVIGGLIFGLGWGLLGYCPGTSMGALGEGRFDAFWGIIGMLVGGGLFAEAYTPLKNSVYKWDGIADTARNITWPELLHVNHWIVIAVFAVLTLLLFVFFEKKKI